MASPSLSKPAATPIGLSSRLPHNYRVRSNTISFSLMTTLSHDANTDRRPQPLIIHRLVLRSRPTPHTQRPHCQPMTLLGVRQAPYDGHDDVFMDEGTRIVVISDESQGPADEGQRAEGTTERGGLGGCVSPEEGEGLTGDGG